MSLGILSIATNRYIEYWFNMVESFRENVENSAQVTFYVFTDQMEEIDEFIRENSDLRIIPIEVKAMGFPEASLFRYEIYTKYSHLLTNTILMHLDADMLIRSNKLLDIEEITLRSANEITLVSHPGYWRPSITNSLKMYIFRPKIFFADSKIRITYGNLGSWETQPESRAFVDRKLRKNYVCGGIWAGRNIAFKKMCSFLALETKKDYEKGKIPIWHDESFMNMWASRNSFTSLSPSYCFDPRYPQLSKLENIVEAVNKNVV